MTYTPINWQTGDTITADKLNRCDNGWAVESLQLFSETVTTADTGQGYATGQLAYVFQEEPPAEAVVTFDGTDYECERDSQYGYGGRSDFSTYPFYISPTTSRTKIDTETAGTHTVALGAQAVEVSAAFGEAVSSCIELPFIPYLPVAVFDSFTDKTYDEIFGSFVGGSLCVVTGYGPVLQMWDDGSRCYMATGGTSPKNGKFDPAIWRTAGASSDLPMSFYKYDSQMN